MAKFSKYNRGRKSRPHHVDRTTADIRACAQMLYDARYGREMPLSYYDALSGRLCGKPSREIFTPDSAALLDRSAVE